MLIDKGGYCFEQNTLFAAALDALGFEAMPVLARSRWNRPPDVATPYTHMILAVYVPGEGKSYMVDVGFGGLQCLQPLLISASDQPTVTPEGAFRITLSPGVDEPKDRLYLKVQWMLRDQWVDMYIFNHTRALNCDMQVANWWSCTRSEARWVSCLFAAKIIDNERHHILNSEYVIRQSTGHAIKKSLSNSLEVIGLLKTVFDIDIPEVDIDISKIDRFFNMGPSGNFHSPLYTAT